MHKKQESNNYLFLQPRHTVPQPLPFLDRISIGPPLVVPIHVGGERFNCSNVVGGVGGSPWFFSFGV
jgi:hypothetical protein